MAANVFCPKGLILIMFSLISAAALERRFSEFKRCADEECSMLLCRGKAVSDFSGPDCRFLSFKKSETIYVYYKLSGRRTDMWAGSVGSHFGYFPKDFLAVNHIYTEKELEAPAEETDFVCFDTGFDGFDNYDIDSLLETSMPLPMGDIHLNNGTSNQRKTLLVTEEEKELPGDVKGTENLDDNNDDAQDLDVVPGGKSAPLPKQEIMTQSPKVEADIEQEQSTTEDNVLENYDLEEKEAKDESTNPALKSLPGDHTTALEKRPVPVSDGKPIPQLETTLGSTFDAVTTDDEDTWKVTANDNGNYLDSISKLVSVSLSTTEDDVLKNDDLEEKEAKAVSTNPELKSLPGDDTIALEKRPVPVSEGKPIPQLKTTLGTTFDAVTTDDEDTWKVTPYVEEESEELADDPEDSSDTEKGIPLLAADAPESEHPAKEDSPTTVHHDDHDQVQQTSEKNLWTSLGDKVFALVTGGETTADISSSEEDEEEDEDEEENAPKPPPNTEKAKEDELKLLSAEPLKESDDLVTSNLANTMEIETNNDSEQLFEEDDDEEEVAEHENEQDETALPTDEQQAFHKNIEESTTAENPLSTGHDSDKPKPHKPQSETTKEEEEGEAEVEIEMQEVKADVDIQDNNTSKHHLEDLGTDLEDENSEEDIVDAEEDTEDIVVGEEDTEDIVVAEKDTENIVVAEDDTEDVVAEEGTEEEIVVAEEDTEEDIVVAEEETKETEVDHKEDDQSDQYQEHKAIDLEKNKHGHIHPELTEEAGFPTEEVDKGSQKEELLEDENAISSTRSHPSQAEDAEPLLESSLPVQPTSEPEYSDDVLRLTLLRNHFSEQYMESFHSILGLKNLFRVEAMFSDLDLELQATRRSHTGTLDDIEKALEAISEASENPILDEIEKMLDGRDLKSDDSQQKDTSLFDEESQILDDFQELAFSLRQKYSVASDSTLLATDTASHLDQDKRLPNIEESETLSHTKETHDDNHTVVKGDDSLMAPEVEERLPEKEDEMAEVHRGADIAVKEDGGHFNKNKDNQPSFDPAEEMQKVPQTILEKPFDMGIGVEMEHSSSGSGDSIEPVPDFYKEEELGFMSKGFLYAGCVLDLVKTKIGEWVILIISRLPEEWKPGESLYGCPWQAVVITALVGVFSVMLFFWKTVLAVKKREYLVDENGLNDRMKTLKKEKDDAISKISDLQKHTEELKEKQKMSEVTNCSAMQRNQELEDMVLQAKTRNDQIAGERNKYARHLEEERANSLKNESRIEKLEKSNGKVQLSRKKTQEALAKITILLDEAKIREEARTVQHKCLERDHTALKEENKTLKVTIKGWEDKHKEMSEQIKVYQKSQKELEDSVVLKDHNVEVLSDLLADLDACDLQKSDNVLPNGEVAIDKKTSIKNRIKQMMDVSRIQTTLTVVEEERDRFMTKLLNEEKARKTMEEQHQELEHSIGALKGEKSHIENQYKILQQKNEIMTEMYQQKENALQQRLTKEELDRRSKESMLSEVGGKAVEAEEQVKVLRQRISEMEEQMKKTEGVYKEQIKEQENKTHSNWVTARNAERALNQEKLETSKLREKLTMLSSQLNERRAPLFRPNSGQNTGPRQGDSYGPSPVSGGAPSPPPMMEGPRRPPSAPVGRKIDPYGPRPPSDPHGRYLDNKLTSGIDMMAPRTSSPANMDTSTPPIDSDTQAEASTESPEPGPGSFIASPIRDSPASGPQGPPVPLGPHDPLLPPGPHGRFPPPGPHRSVRPLGPHYHPGAGPGHHIPPHGPPLPANGHPGMPMPPPGSIPSNGHAFRPRLGPDPRGPPPPHFRPHLPHHFPPMLPPPGVRGPMGPRPHFPPDMRFPGPRDHGYPPAHLPPGGMSVHHSDSFAQGPPEGHQNAHGHHTVIGQGQDLAMKANATPQDSDRSAMAEP